MNMVLMYKKTKGCCCLISVTMLYFKLKNYCSTDFISILLTGNLSKASREIVIKKETSILMD